MDVIILGAGPTGLMLSNQLSRFGVDHIIIDAKAGPTDQSRALVVHARSLEIYEQLGVSDRVLADGQRNNGINFYKHGRIATSVTLVGSDEKSTPFPFLMMYEQSKNEQLLYQNLLDQGREVKWNTRVTKITKVGALYQLTILENDTNSLLQCKYLIGCDGGKSMVREFSGVPFSGGSYLNVFFVADTHIKGFSSEKLSIFLKKDGLNMLFAMKSTDHFRALGIMPKQYYHQPDLPFEDGNATGFL
jgi:2-polyprenyl-6-methoxyphenol hydroxylase-like FAD-dependent oxidoreductase